MKTCTRCHEAKPLDQFGKRSDRPGKLVPRCKSCVNAYIKEWRKTPGGVASSERSRDKRLERDRGKYAANREAIRAQQADYYRRTAEARRAYRARVGKPRARGAVGDYSEREYQRLVRRYHGKCAWCRTAPADTRDHVIPITRGGTNYIGNVVPACMSCNSSRNDKFVTVWKHGQ